MSTPPRPSPRHMSHPNQRLPPSSTGTMPHLSSPSSSPPRPRILIIGAGSRGNAYAGAIVSATNGIIVAVCEPMAYKRGVLGERYIWGSAVGGAGVAGVGQEFADWREWVRWEEGRRERERKQKEVGKDGGKSGKVGDEKEVEKGVDAVMICVLDEMHAEVLLGLKDLKLHIMCEKPLVRSLAEGREVWKAMRGIWGGGSGDDREGGGGKPKQEKIFAVGHVLRYSPHNMLLRKLVVEDRVIGEVMSINHTEPVGWWHFTHSYVRGNWRHESTTAPSLLTKSCHDIDLLLWLLSSPPPNSPHLPPHLPTHITSTGSLQFFRPAHKPTLAGAATNCLSCPAEETCKYSAKKVYLSSGSGYLGLMGGNTGWPVNVVVPEIEDLVAQGGIAKGEEAVLKKLGEDWDADTPQKEKEGRNWFGRCVFEAENDVCDEQVVTISWADDPRPLSSSSPSQSETERVEVATSGMKRSAKTAVFHMVAHTRKICHRYTHIYGVEGEIYADSEKITVSDFGTGEERLWRPGVPGGGHGGGDEGLARGFVRAVERVIEGEMREISEGKRVVGREEVLDVDVERVQREELGVDLEEVIRSHAVVWMAEEARRGKKVVDFEEWWKREMGGF